MLQCEEEKMEPRPYQLLILDYLRERNGIIYLPTGSGKTFICILALKHFSRDLQRSCRDGGKRAIYMCTTVELARQQYRKIKKTTNLKAGLYIGDRNVDNWSISKWETEIEETQVLIGTAQVFVDLVNRNILAIKDLSIVIIDECHHGTKNHPIHVFLSSFQYCDQDKLPRVIGLTAVLIKGNKLNNTITDLKNLEATFRGYIVTINDENEMNNVMLYSAKPMEEMISYSPWRVDFPQEIRIEQLIYECINILENYYIPKLPQQMSKNLEKIRLPNKKNVAKNSLKDFVSQMKDLGLYAGSISIMLLIIEFEVKKCNSEIIALRNMYRMVILYCERIRHIIVKELKSSLDNDDDVDNNAQSLDKKWQSLEIIKKYSTPKLLSLFEHMHQKFNGKRYDEISCLLFVEKRYSAKIMYYLIKDYVSQVPQLQNIIRPQYVIGKESTSPDIRSFLETKNNNNIIKQFHSKECNFIVCSNVLEEGIDIQSCNYVFVFDNIKTFNSYIQSKGRARKNNSFYSIFESDAQIRKTLEKIKDYRKTHELIKSFLKNRIIDSNGPNKDEISKQFVEVIPPFLIPSGATLVPSSALALIHRYCQSLPCDSFGVLRPTYTKLEPNEEGHIAISIRLPIQSCVKETITSDYYLTTHMAKVSAAFKACIRLYELGELNDQFLPLTKTECISKISDSLFSHWKKHHDDVNNPKIGKQLKRMYDCKCPEELYNSLPRLGEKSFAYSIEFSTDFEKNSYNEHIIKYLGSKSTYAILLNKKLPKLAKMPLFITQGKLHVKISENPIECVIYNEQQLNLLKGFHTMLFKDLLQLWKAFLTVDHRNEENSFLIVPMNNLSCIDWDLIFQFQHLNASHPYTVEERKNAQYRPEDYLNKVVTKWYNQFRCEYFVVTKVLTDHTPMSPFSDNSFKTFESFYSSRYGLNIVNKKQFLLEVKALTERRNFFNNASNKGIAKKKELSEIILIPELCHNYKYPADLWLKALFLPTILHRVYNMLNAESLRRRINKFLDLDKYFNDYTPKPLTIDISLKRTLDDDGNQINEEKQPKRFLRSLPTEKSVALYQNILADINTWKTYLEPIDLNRNIDKIYQVDLDYYNKFISGFSSEFSHLKDEEQEYTTLQFEMPDSSRERNVPLMNITNSSQLSIMEVPDEEKMEIDILKRSFEPEHCLKSAEQYEFLAAITASRVNDVFDMERFEVLGDAYLKFSVSLYLANKYTSWHEGFLTAVKGRMVSNRNLLYCMMDTNICQMICGTLFEPKTAWLPPLASLPSNILEILIDDPMYHNFDPIIFYNLNLTEEEIISGKCTKEHLEHFTQAYVKLQNPLDDSTDIDNGMNIFINKHKLSDKIVADTLEALLGVCVKNYGLHRTFRMLEFFGICKSEGNNSNMDLLDLKLSNEQLRTNIPMEEVDSFLNNYSYLEKNLGYTFRDRTFLLQALTHPSYPTNRLTGSYQLLEFLGDAILDMLITCYIFEKHQYMDPGKITDLRTALVNNITLGCICVYRRFHLFLLHENEMLSESINAFVAFQESRNYHISDQVQILMEEIPYDEINPINEILNCSNKSENDENSDEESEEDFIENTQCDKENLLRSKKPYNMAENIDVPKALGDIVEALIAAVYLDCRDLNTTWKVIYNLFKSQLEDFGKNIPIDAVRRLSEIKQAKPKYSKPIIDNKKVMIKCTFNCLNKTFTTNGFGNNTKQAKKAAATQALQILAKYSN